MPEYEDLEPNFRLALIRKMKKESPFWTLLGMELIDAKRGWAVVKLPFARKLTHPLHIAHGGAIFSPADSAIAMALLGLVKKSETFTTVEMKINYIRPFNGGEITAEAKITHKGNKIAIGDVEVRDTEGRLVAKALATYMIMKKP